MKEVCDVFFFLERGSSEGLGNGCRTGYLYLYINIGNIEVVFATNKLSCVD